MSGEEPGTRTTIDAVTPDGEACTLIVYRHGIGSDARVLVSHHGIWQATAVLTLDQAGVLAEGVRKAA
ncbi:MAG: hypothetical protein ACREXJ_00250 [Gammaproteobacteria bacterium]